MFFSVYKCLICGFAVFYHFIKFSQELFKIVLTLLNTSHCLISFLFSALKGLFKSKNVYEKHQFSLNNRFIWNFLFYDAYLYHENLLGSVCTTAEGNLERKKCTYISIKFHSELDFIQIGQEMITKKKSNE